MTTLEDVINHIKTELMPNYDYDEYTRRHEEWEKIRAAEKANNTEPTTENITEEVVETVENVEETAEEVEEVEEIENTEVESEDDMSW